jgi:hypothetical protein
MVGDTISRSKDDTYSRSVVINSLITFWRDPTGLSRGSMVDGDSMGNSSPFSSRISNSAVTVVTTFQLAASREKINYLDYAIRVVIV